MPFVSTFGKLLLILQNPVSYSLLWKAFVNLSPLYVEQDCHIKMITQNCHIFITFRVLLLTSLGFKACLNQHSTLSLLFLSFTPQQAAWSCCLHNACSTNINKQKCELSMNWIMLSENCLQVKLSVLSMCSFWV